jgi:hypothetical protein
MKNSQIANRRSPSSEIQNHFLTYTVREKLNYYNSNYSRKYNCFSDPGILWLHSSNIPVLCVKLHRNRRRDRDLIHNTGLRHHSSVLPSWRKIGNCLHWDCPDYINWHWSYCSTTISFRISRV